MTKESKLSLLLKSFENYRKTRDIEHLNDIERILEYDGTDNG
ncbi:hypothetical protein [Streptococcus suis]|nr:hypothetical protein [Streptococcus suis]